MVSPEPLFYYFVEKVANINFYELIFINTKEIYWWAGGTINKNCKTKKIFNKALFYLSPIANLIIQLMNNF